MSELEKIQEQIAKLRAQEQELITRERSSAISQIRALMAKFQISASDLATATKNPGSRKKAVAKFCDPATGKTWSGRGRRPHWVKDTMAI